MTWPYHFLTLTDQEKHHRRELLDRYGLFSQLSALIPIAGYQLYRLGTWIYSERQRSKVGYTAIPSSPNVRKARHTTAGVVVRKWRSTVWWLQSDIAPGWGLGLRGQWIATGSWMVWLLFLCVHRTGDDYLHITKRFGEVAVAQFPLHYMLAMRSIYSPLALTLKASHEQFNPWHRLNAKVIYTLLLLHATFYMNFYIQAGLFPQKLKATAVIIGMTAFSLLTILVSSSLELVRRWNYRLFFLIHLTIGVSLLPLLFFHASHLRLYVTEAMVLFVFDVLLRKLDTVTAFATITPIPNTKLVKLKLPIPPSKLHRFHAAPGQHVYLNIPPRSTPAGTSFPSIHDLLYNPFTIADVSTSDVTLVLRALTGPTTKALHSLTKLPKSKPPINIEGPLGCSQYFPNLVTNYDRILLVAGGVGATFILPVYKNLRDLLVSESRSPDRLTFTWSMRSAAEASWAIESEESRKEIEEDENVKIFLTRNRNDGSEDGEEEELLPVDGSVELDDLGSEAAEAGIKVNGGKERPDLKAIVDGIFRLGGEERVAVLVCGPKGMARELRTHVGRWVGEGRKVWYHDESFGW